MTEACSSLPDYYITLALCRQLNQVNLRQGTQKGIKKSTPQKVYVAILVPKSKLGFEVDLLHYTPKLKKVNAFCKNRQTCGACKRLREAAGNGFATETGKARRQTRFLCRCAHKRDAFSSVPFVVLRGSLPSKRCFVYVLR